MRLRLPALFASLMLAVAAPGHGAEPAAAARAKTEVRSGAAMDTSRINDPTVRAAVDAWQAEDLQKWLSFFTPDAILLDDGKPRDFKKFSAEIGKERFTRIERVENGGRDVYGQFHSDAWGDFRTYFKFHLGADGKFDRLEIGQAN